jgi:hypothetical protein
VLNASTERHSAKPIWWEYFHRTNNPVLSTNILEREKKRELYLQIKTVLRNVIIHESYLDPDSKTF